MSLTADTTLVLPATTPFEFSRSVSALDRAASRAGGRVGRGDELLTGGFAPEPFVARLSADGPDAVRAHVDWVDAAGDGSAVADHVDALLSLSDDPTPLYEAARTDEAFAPVVDALFGYHPVRFPTAFEAACRAALSRRVPTPAAADSRGALVRELGRTAAVDGATVSLFPTPRTVRGNPAAVRDVVGNSPTGRRTRSVDALDGEPESRAVLAAADAFLEADLRELATDDLCERFEALPGFDSTAAASVALRGFGRPSALPAADPRLRAAVGAAYGVEDPSEEVVRRLADPYGDYRGYWAQYLRAWNARKQRVRSGS